MCKHSLKIRKLLYTIWKPSQFVGDNVPAIAKATDWFMLIEPWLSSDVYRSFFSLLKMCNNGSTSMAMLSNGRYKADTLFLASTLEYLGSLSCQENKHLNVSTTLL